MDNSEDKFITISYNKETDKLEVSASKMTKLEVLILLGLAHQIVTTEISKESSVITVPKLELKQGGRA